MNKILFFCAMLAGCSDSPSAINTPVSVEPKITKTDKWNEAHITRANFNGVYPFSVDKGILRCEFNKGIPLIYFSAGGSMYAINGTAQGVSPKLPKTDTILADNPAMTGQKLSMGDILKAGIVLCEK